MTLVTDITYERLDLQVDGVGVEIATARRRGALAPIVFLHGFGSTKEDYVDVVHVEELADRPVILFDAPGSGESVVDDPERVDIPFLVEVAARALDSMGYHSAHLIGHSMGGLAALLLASADPTRGISFVDIEGNLAPEDCFFSRQIIEHPRDDAQGFLDDFRARVRRSRFAGSALYAAGLAAKVSPAVVQPIFASMVKLSDTRPLLDELLGLALPTMVMYGEQNAGLSYLPRLAAAGIELAEIPHSGHFPMYSNAPAMWDRITRFISAHEGQ